MIKLTRLIRLIKVIKQKSKILKHAQELLQLGHSFERLVFFLFASMMSVHIIACLWVFFSQLAPEDASTWIDDEFNEMSIGEKYLTSLYFTITTFSTVGYGDISAHNFIEKMFCIVVMIAGVTAFAMGTSAMTNLIQTYDHENSKLQERVVILNRIYKEFCLPLRLYENVKKSLKLHYKDDIDDLITFVNELPQDLRLEVSLFIYEDTFKQLEFLQNRPVSFITWICPLLRPMILNKDQYVFFEGDDIACIYFLKKGDAGYVLPRHKNVKYV